MWMRFTFEDGSNPYITKTNSELWWMLTHYEWTQTGTREFHITNPCNPPRTYKGKQDAIEAIAIAWQHTFDEFNYYWEDLSGWGDFFTEYGRKYGKMREFHENGIC